MTLKDKAALITGASSGIGAATALRLAEEGCALFLAGGRNVDGLSATAETCRRAGAEVAAQGVDLSHLEEAADLLDKTVRTLGPPDILVNCAGARGRKPAGDFTFDEIRTLFNVNAMVPFFLCGQVARHMIEQGGGRILNIGSTAGEGGTAGNTLYSATKGALHAMTRALAVELGPYGIRVNAIAPGTILSEGTKGRLEANPERAEQMRQRIPIGRFGRPEEVAALAFFMVSDEADYLNGEVIVMDGGRLRQT